MATHGNALQHYTTTANTATHCNTLQHTATHCNTLYNTLQHNATHCNTLQHTATHCNTLQHTDSCHFKDQHSQNYRSTHCNAHCNTRCNTLQHAATHCNTLQHTSVGPSKNQYSQNERVSALQHATTRCKALQHTATHCKALQHTGTHCNTLKSVTLSTNICRMTGPKIQNQLTAQSLSKTATALIFEKLCQSPRLLNLMSKTTYSKYIYTRYNASIWNDYCEYETMPFLSDFTWVVVLDGTWNWTQTYIQWNLTKICDYWEYVPGHFSW